MLESPLPRSPDPEALAAEELRGDSPARGNWRTALPLLPVLVVAFLVASPGLRAGFYADDWFQVLPRTPGEILQTFTGDWSTGARSPGGLYRPLIRVTFGIDEWIWGANPLGYHLTNMALWLLLLSGVYSAALLLTQGRRFLAAFATLYVGLFPTNAEAVTWLSGRTDLQAGCALIWSFVFLLLAMRRESWKDLGICALLLASGLLSKEIAVASMVVFPLGVLLLGPRDLCPGLKRSAVLMPFALGAAYLVLRFAAIGGLGGYHEQRGRPLRITEILEAAASMISALSFPRWGLADNFYSPTAAVMGLLLASLAIVLSRFRRPVVFCFAAALLFLTPMVGLGVGGGMGGRLLLVPQLFVALALASFAGLSLVGRLTKWPLMIVYLYVFLAWTADSLDAHLAWKRAWPANRELMNQLVDRIEAEPVPSDFVFEEPSFGEGNRLLFPGMTGVLAARTIWEWRGREAVFGDPSPDEPYVCLTLRLPGEGSHRLIPALAPPADEGAIVLRALPSGELDVFGVAAKHQIRLVGQDAETVPRSADESTTFKVGRSGTLSGHKIGPDGGVRFEQSLTESNWTLTGRAELDIESLGTIRLEHTSGETQAIPFGYPPKFWGTEVFAVRLPTLESEPTALTWNPAQESVRFELQELTLHQYVLTRLPDGGHDQQ